MAQTVQSQQSTKSEVKEKAAEVQQQAKQTVKEVTDQAQQQSKTMVNRGKSQTVGQLSSVAKALRTTSQELRHEDNEAIARYSEMVADKTEEFSSYLAEKSVDELLSDFEKFARRQPEIFLGTAFVSGLLLGRFVKSSSSRANDDEEEQYYKAGGYSEASGPLPEYKTPGPYSERRATTDGAP